MNNIIPHDYSVTREMRGKLKKHKPLVIWLTGLSGSGKSTIANAVEKELYSKKIQTYTLDGDNIRGGLNSDLGFSSEDRTENVRRIAEVAKLFFDSGAVVLSAFITPLKSDRQLIQHIIGEDNLVGIFVDTSLEECERRDVKGLYKKAREGKIQNFTGINAPFEVPLNSEITISTENEDIQVSVDKILNFITPIIKPTGDE